MGHRCRKNGSPASRKGALSEASLRPDRPTLLVSCVPSKREPSHRSESGQTYLVIQESGLYSVSIQPIHLIVCQAQEGSDDHGQLVHLEGCQLVDQGLAAACKTT